MDDKEIESVLLAAREEAASRVQELSAELGQIVTAAEGSNLDDEHDPEGTTIAFEREQLAALRDQTQQRIAEIDHALERLAAGGYGRCESCGATIPAERLAARPAVRLCVNCAARRH